MIYFSVCSEKTCKMFMKSISIIIPVYNVSEYLSECLDSVCEQNIEGLQVICIDDCSTDDSLRILELYQKKYMNMGIKK